MYEKKKIDELLNQYNKRYYEVYNFESLSSKDISSSTSLFEELSIKNRNPIPRRLEVLCIVGGLPFEEVFTNKIVELQKRIGSVLNGKLNYLVEPQNLAVEVLVLKWPNNDFNQDIIVNAKKEMIKINKKKFKLISHGFQFHQDGAIILRCIDDPNNLRILREELKQKISSLPQKQSSWCHIPLGRILEPLDKKVLNELIELADYSQINFKHKTEVNKFHLIKEKRWYQLERETLCTIDLSN